MIRFRQRNPIWLVILSIMAAIALLGGVPTSPLVGLFMVLGLGGAWLASMLNFEPKRTADLVDAIRTPLSRTKVSPQAREASSRAAQRGTVMNDDLALVDVGLIATGSSRDGAVMRRTRGVSKDDDSVRPFLALQVAPIEADRNAKVRFEIIDQNGREQYIHEMNIYLRDGELNILADHQLRLYGNPNVEGMGDWDLRVYLDGQLIGMHSFTLGASEAERRNRLSGDARTPRRFIIPEADDDAEEDEDIPVSLEDLLRDNNRSSRNR